MFNEERYYQPAGDLSPGGIITTLGISLLAAIALGVVYGIVAFYNPFVYLSFLGALFLGAGLGIVVNKASIWAKVSNKRIVIGISVIVGLAGLYAAWVGWLFAVVEYERLIISPLEILNFIQLASITGVYEIFGATPTGLALYAIWGIEALLITGGTVRNVLGDLNTAPLCDDCGEWTEAEAIANNIEPVRNPSGMIKSLEARSMSALTDLGRSIEVHKRRTEVIVYQCNDCKGPRYLSVYDVTITYDSDGDAKIKAKAIVENLIINSSEYDELKNWQRKLTESVSTGQDGFYEGEENKEAE